MGFSLFIISLAKISPAGVDIANCIYKIMCCEVLTSQMVCCIFVLHQELNDKEGIRNVVSQSWFIMRLEIIHFYVS